MGVDRTTFLTNCRSCGGTTSKSYAKQNDGRCKQCVEGAPGTVAVPARLIEFIRMCRPDCKDLSHLEEFIEMLEGAPRSNTRAMCSLPIRHGKSWTVVCAIIFWLLKDPTIRVIVMTHTTPKVKDLSKDIRQLARDMGIKIQVRTRGADAQEGYDTIESWRTTAGGGVSVKTPGRSSLGADCDVFIWDDPFPGQEEADKPEVREQIDADIAFYTNRLSPGGSCIGIMSRFHPDDAIGRRIKRSWRCIQSKAILDMGTPDERALAPLWWPLDVIKERRREDAEVDPTERTFFSQWQNEPFAPSTNYLDDPGLYAEVPKWPGFKIGMGIDMAFTKGRSADWFAIVVGQFYRGTCYVLNAYRFKGDPRQAAAEIQTQLAMYGRMPIFSYVSGPERIAIPMLAEQGIHVQPMQAEVNKLWRAQRTINLWRAKRVLLPQDAPWRKLFVDRAKQFRGVDGDEDDEIDALVSLVNSMMWSDTSGIQTFGSWRY